MEPRTGDIRPYCLIDAYDAYLQATTFGEPLGMAGLPLRYGELHPIL
jgi:hypothetical protein